MRSSAILLRALVLLMGLGSAAPACSSSHAALETCLVEGGTVCGPGTSCLNLSASGADGQCHGIGFVCSLPCLSSTDCAPMGKNAVCSTACSTIVLVDGGPTMGVCTPYQ